MDWRKSYWKYVQCIQFFSSWYSGGYCRYDQCEGYSETGLYATDFYSQKPYPVYLYYNPFDEDKVVEYTSAQQADLFDIVAKEYVARNIVEKGAFTIPAKAARIVVELPVETELTKEGQRIVANKQYIISYK